MGAKVQISQMQLLNGDRPIVQYIGHLSPKQKNIVCIIFRPEAGILSKSLQQNIMHRKHRKKTLPKAQRTRGLSSAYQSNYILVISKEQTQNLIKFHLQNIDQAPTSKSRHQQTSASLLNLKFKILSKPGFGISIKIQHHYLYKTSAAKY